jgi:tRNA uridine 5-carboxymethylaminomethyl modification enzyme
MAGINAACHARGVPPVVLRRDEAVIGVLIDEITRERVREPQRIAPTRIEHRLELRSDNANLRLTPLAARLGLVSAKEAEAVAWKQEELAAVTAALRSCRLYPSEVTNARLTALGLAPLRKPTTAAELLRRPDVSYHQLQAVFGLPNVQPGAMETLTITARYAMLVEARGMSVECEGES